MNHPRIISIGTNSMIYHKPGCRYAKQIKDRNQMFLSRYHALNEGYHACQYCNSMNYHMRTEKQTIQEYSGHKNMQFRYRNGILYVKTEIGCWKLVYVRGDEKIALYHRNTTGKPLDFMHPQYEAYHRQKDKPFCYSICGALDYIDKHDRYKAAVKRGEKIIRFSKKKYERYAARVQKRREISRVEKLFELIEKQNKGYKELSFC